MLNNADEIRDALSPEAWGSLSRLRTTFARQKFQADPPVHVCMRVTRKLSELTTHLIPQFYGLAENSMMGDDGWRFCRLGQQLERAVITANAPLACAKAFTGPADRPARLGHHTEIELSAFLRLLGTRDAYRRVYQMRAEPLPVLQLLFQNPEAPRSVLHSVANCADLLRGTSGGQEAPGFTDKPVLAMEAFCDRLRRIDWASYFEHPLPASEDFPAAAAMGDASPVRVAAAAANGNPEATVENAGLAPEKPTAHGQALSALLGQVLRGTMDLHNVIADVFLNHQARISTPTQPYLKGLAYGA